MLRREVVEDKAQRTPDIVTVSGQVYRKADYEDPARPGFTVAGRLYTSAELHACGVWDLIAPSGFHFHGHLPLQLRPDPSRVSSAEAPEALRVAVAEAEKNLKAVEAKVSAALDARAAAEEEQLAAARAQNARRYNTAIVAVQEAEQRRLDAEMALPPLRVELSRANDGLRWWLDDERLHRSGAVERPQPVVF